MALERQACARALHIGNSKLNYLCISSDDNCISPDIWQRFLERLGTDACRLQRRTFNAIPGGLELEDFSRALCTNSSLTSLLFWTRISNANAWHLSEALTVNSGLTHLDMCCSISNVGIRHLVEALKVNRSLTHLALKYICLSDETDRLLLDAFSSGHLQRLVRFVPVPSDSLLLEVSLAADPHHLEVSVVNDKTHDRNIFKLPFNSLALEIPDMDYKPSITFRTENQLRKPPSELPLSTLLRAARSRPGPY